MQDVPQEKQGGQTEEQLEKPPFFKSWAGMYWLVIGNLILLILLFYLLTAYYE